METWEAKAYIQDQAKVRNSTNIDIQLEIMRQMVGQRIK